MYQQDLKIKKRILISGIGGEIAQGASRIIREHFPSYEIHGSEYHNRFGKIAFSVFAIMVTHAEPLATNPEVDGNPAAGSKNPGRSTGRY